jgi:tetratricopeptide (TPR) repeat protein
LPAGDVEEANEKLEEIDLFCRGLPEELAVRLFIYRNLQKWDLMEAVAKRLVAYRTDIAESIVNWAVATRRAKSLEAAKLILKDAIAQHGEVAVFHFDLACYERELGNLEAAKAHLTDCFRMDKSWRIAALEDAV